MACPRSARRMRAFYPSQAPPSVPQNLTYRNRGRMFSSTNRLGFRSRVAAGLIAGLSILAGCEHALTTESTRGLAPELPRLVVNPGDYVKIYVHAFQDDWELFMGDRVTTGLQTVPNVVFIYTTIRAIVDYESNNQAAPFVEVHAPEYDRTANPNDHPDHLATADAVHAAAGTRSWNLAWYVDYQTKNLAVNLTQAQHDLKQAVFYAYDNFMGAGGYGREQWESDYQAWLSRTYVRTAISTPPPPPATPTNLQAVARSGTRIDLTWTDNATNETGYYVERAPDVAGVAGTYTQIATLATHSNSFSSTALSSNTANCFRVPALNPTD